MPHAQEAQEDKTLIEIMRLKIGSKFQGKAFVNSLVINKDKKDKKFGRIKLMDSTGHIFGMIWNQCTFSDSELKKIEDPLAGENVSKYKYEGLVIGFGGQVTKFNENKQFIMTSIEIMDQNKFPPDNFQQNSPVDLAYLEKQFFELVDSCDENLSQFLRSVFKGKIWEHFKKSPAAVTVHHAYSGGLLEHTIAVARTARSLACTYRETGMDVNLSLAIGGALLHDIGKMESYEIPPGLKMTVKGTVIDHIVLGYTTFSALAGEFGLDQGLALAIGHILVSHHGCREYGSPVLPASPEAMIVSAADELDFRLFCWKNSTDQMEEGREISDYNPSTQRRFWKREETNGL